MKIVLLLTCFALVANAAPSCKEYYEDVCGSFQLEDAPCRRRCSNEIVPLAECSSTPECCLSEDGTKCLQTQEKKEFKPLDVPPPSLDEAKKIVEESQVEEEAAATSRSFNIHGGLPSPSNNYGRPPQALCQLPPPFPMKCKMDKYTPYSINPPVNVPYCLRIPCTNYNAPLDANAKACRNMPGCYYDDGLAAYRNTFGPNILPGVPVCHLAIRNTVFLREANKVKARFGQWTSFLTKCLLDTFKTEIETPKDGCKSIPMLEYFGHYAKLAGWTNISPNECNLIDACWISGKGCFYPTQINNYSVKSRQYPIKSKFSSMQFGRHKCQHFDTSSVTNILNGYHKCLISGCTLDDEIISNYENYFYTLGKQLNATEHYQMQMALDQGYLTPENFQEFFMRLNPYNFMSKYQPTYGNANPGFHTPMNNVGGHHNNNGNTGLKFPTDMGAGFGDMFCGMPGYRPCPPATFNPHATKFMRPRVCPYKPLRLFNFPPLQGSFDGCCDLNLCYLPKQELINMHSGVSHYYTKWSKWTPCSRTCGLGERRRFRQCLGKDRSQCTEGVSDTMTCEESVCAQWMQWGRWSGCSATCDGGIAKRMRQCTVPGQCVGENTETRYCNTRLCPKIYSDWSGWEGTCEPCGDVRYRTRTCLMTAKCSKHALRETEQCQHSCGVWGSYGDYGQCVQSTSGCVKRRYRTCSSYYCKGEAVEEKACTGCFTGFPFSFGG